MNRVATRWALQVDLGALAAWIAAGVVAAPVIAVLGSLAAPYGETIGHVIASLGADYALGTLTLALGVGLAGGAVGIAAALLVALCDFPLRRFAAFALVLPLAAPAYLIAYAYADLVGPFGAFAPLDPPSVRTLWGAVFVLALGLYPYAYLTARAAFAARSASMIEAARTLGASPFRAALLLLAPASRPAIAAGVALIMMETAAEFGVADYFGVPTLSVGIFRTWNSFGDLAAASQLASGLFLFAALLIAFEQAGRRGRSGEAPRTKGGGARFALKGPKAVAASLFCLMPPILGFAVPLATIAAKASATHWPAAMRGLSEALSNSIAIAAAGGALTLAVALALAYAERASRSPVASLAARLATLGYAIPGAVIAIGILTVLSFSGGGAVIAGPAALLYAYAARFLTAGHGAIAGGLAQVDPGFDAAAKTLGAAPARTLAAIHAPLMRRSIIAAATIVFVDIVKELPATLILRDFNFETLATRVYRLAGDERLAEAAPNALLLIALGALPIMLLGGFSDGADRRRVKGSGGANA
jgi:iron(III) transport system permease protein